MQWNISSLKKETFSEIREFRPNIICLQETRQNIKNTPSYNFINKTRSCNLQGGGIAVGIDKQLVFRDLTAILPECLKQEDIEIILA